MAVLFPQWSELPGDVRERFVTNAAYLLNRGYVVYDPPISVESFAETLYANSVRNNTIQNPVKGLTYVVEGGTQSSADVNAEIGQLRDQASKDAEHRSNRPKSKEE